MLWGSSLRASLGGLADQCVVGRWGGTGTDAEQRMECRVPGAASIEAEHELVQVVLPGSTASLRSATPGRANSVAARTPAAPAEARHAISDPSQPVLQAPHQSRTPRRAVSAASANSGNSPAIPACGSSPRFAYRRHKKTRPPRASIARWRPLSFVPSSRLPPRLRHRQ